jgi:glycine amidinotransferase/scyllo-inosamine-4-phosphate amidinotransferase 1
MISTYNEWDPLKSVVVGSATGAHWPSEDPVFKLEAERTLWKETPMPTGSVPQWIVDEANEDLQALADTLTQLGVEVLRPREQDFSQVHGMYNYCPRDRLLAWGDTLVDTAMMYPCRDLEIHNLKQVTDRAGTIKHMPRGSGLVLDAANICRLNDTWLYLESDSGNRAAYDWLVAEFPQVKIELCNFYAGVHIDSTIVPVREGLVLLNGARISPNNCPESLKNWSKLYVDDVVPQGFHEYPYASKWIALNMLVVDPHTVIVDRHQTDLIRRLEHFRFTVIPLELRHSRTLGGGFHCVTLDLVRNAAK